MVAAGIYARCYCSRDPRAVFQAARRSASCTTAVHAAAATLELRANRQPAVARNVFELGMKRFGADPAFMLEYADTLLALAATRQTPAPC